MMKKFESLSKTLISSFVIFQLAFAGAAAPVVSYAFEGEVAAADAVEASEVTEVAEEADSTEVVEEESVIEDAATVEQDEASGEQVAAAEEPAVAEVTEQEAAAPSDKGTEKDGQGVLTVCKIIVDKNGNIVSGSAFPGETFTIPFDDGSVVFSTDNFVPNTVFGNSDRFNIECRRHENLPFGLYNYAQEVVSGPTEWDVTYTEGDINSIDDGYAYDAENIFSDGKIYLGVEGQGLLTDVTLYVINKEKPGTSCPAGVISARINFSKVAQGAQVNGWRNWGEGDLAPQVFVGGNTNAHQYDDGEWFPLTNPDGSYINDPDISGYSDVKGLAVQRMEGKIRVVLYGFHEVPSHEVGTKAASGGQTSNDSPKFDQVVAETQGKEFAQFGIQLSHAGFGPENSMISPYNWSNDNSNPRIHNPAINDSANPMDGRGSYGGYINQYNPRFDRMRTFDPFRVHSVLVVTTASDGFYASYDITPDSEEDCGSEDDDPVITLPKIGCIETSVTSYDFLNLPGVSVSGGVGNVTLSVDQSGVMFGVPGLYTITYTATDSNGNIDEKIMLVTIGDCDGGEGGGDDDAPVLTIPANACYEVNSPSFNLLDGVSAVDFAGDPIVLVEGGNLTIAGSVDFSVAGSYDIVYTITDPFGSDSATRTVTISDDCDNGGGNGGDGDGDGDGDGNGNGGGSGGGSSSGSRGGRNRGEVLGAETGPACVRFTQYYDTGDTGGEISALQEFLNAYMGAGVVVNGVYDVATTQAVHDFQAKHWDDIIDPWTPPLSPNTTGRFYKTTRATVNAIIDCPEAPVYLEDPQTMFEITSVANQNEFDAEDIANVIEALAGEVLGVTEYEGK